MLTRNSSFLLLIAVLFIGCASDSDNASQTASGSTTNADSGFETREAVPPTENMSQILTLNLEDQTIEKGKVFCSNVQVRDFNSIMSMQYTTRWDPEVLTFSKVQGFGLKDLSASNFGATRASEGHIAISWFDQDLKSITLPDGNTIYQICFEAAGNAGSSSALQFTGDPVIVEISNADGEIIGFSSRKARITIQ